MIVSAGAMPSSSYGWLLSAIASRDSELLLLAFFIQLRTSTENLFETSFVDPEHDSQCWRNAIVWLMLITLSHSFKILRVVTLSVLRST